MGTLATLVVNLVLNPAQFNAGLAAAKAQATGMTSALGVMGGVAAVGAAVGFAKAASAAIEWEDSMAGVRRTVELSDDEMGRASEIYGQIEQDLLGLAKTIPISTQELASMAETAGSLGVATDEISEFARVTATLAEMSQDLTPDATARAFGTLRTTMGLTEDQLNNTASAIVNLGISGASTEAEILSMAERASGAFGALNISIEDLLAWSAAMSNVREFSEAGGTTLQRLGLIIQKSIGQGGEKLEATAKAAGMTEEAFSDLFRRDASAAMFEFIQGLSQVDGEMRNVLLRAAGFTDIRLTRGLNKLVGAMTVGAEGNLADALADARAGMEDEQVFEDMATERFKTTAAQMEILGNKIQVFAIKIGKYLLPVIGMIVDLFGAFIDKVDALATAFPGLTAVLTPLLAGLSALLAMRFGAKLLSTLLPGAATTAIGGAWAGVASSILTPFQKLGGLISGTLDFLPNLLRGRFGMLGKVLGGVLGGALRIAVLGAVAILLPIIDEMAQKMFKIYDDINKTQQDIVQKGAGRQTVIEQMGLAEAEAELTRLKKLQEDAWAGEPHGLKLFADFVAPQASHETERLIALTEAHINSLKAQDSALGGVISNVKDYAGSIADAVKAPGPGLFEQLRGTIGGEMDALKVNVPLTLTGIKEGFAAARKLVSDGFGSVKKALQNPPQLIPIDTRIENTEVRLRKTMRNVKRATEANDPINQQYWIRATATAAMRVDRMKGKTGQTANAIKKQFKAMGIDVAPVWNKMAEKAKQKAGESKTNVVNRAKETATGVKAAFAGQTLFAEGAALVSTLADGLVSNLGAVTEAANRVAAAAAAPFKGSSPPKVGPLKTIYKDGQNVVQQVSMGMMSQRGLASRTSMDVAGAFRPRWGSGMIAAGAGGAGGVHYHVGTLVADEGGLDELDRRMDRRRRRKARARRLYNETD